MIRIRISGDALEDLNDGFSFYEAQMLWRGFSGLVFHTDRYFPGCLAFFIASMHSSNDIPMQ